MVVRVLGCLACLILALGSRPAYSRYLVGVNSNFVIERDRVLFAQSDGSLTLLDLQTGAALSRSDEDNSGHFSSLYPFREGIFCEYAGVIRLLDRRTLKEIWRANDTYCADIGAGLVVSTDGYRRVACRALASGKTLWTYDFAGSLFPGHAGIIIEKGRVLLCRTATYEPALSPEVVVLDLRTGRQLWRQTPPPGVHFLGAYFDGQQTHIAAGHLPARPGQPVSPGVGRGEVPFEMIQVCDVTGRPIQTIPAPPDLRKTSFDGEAVFCMANRYYAHGRMWASADAVPPRMTGQPTSAGPPPRRAPGAGDDLLVLNENLFRFGDGRLAVRVVSSKDASNAWTRRTDLEFRDSTVAWKGSLPYLEACGGKIVHAARSGDRLLLGTDLGSVECIEISSGRSVWMYRFPPMDFGKQIEIKPQMAFNRAGQRQTPNPRLVFDPEPRDPLRRIREPREPLARPRVLGMVFWMCVLLFVGMVFLGRLRSK